MIFSAFAQVLLIGQIGSTEVKNREYTTKTSDLIPIVKFNSIKACYEKYPNVISRNRVCTRF
jgi:hypothetical protein